MGKVLSRYYSVVVLLVLWEALARSGMVNPRLFPSLLAIGQQLGVLLSSGLLYHHAGATLWRVVAGFGLAGLAGIPLGMAMARSASVRSLLEPAFAFGYPVPRVALYPILVFALGLGHLSKIALVFLECLYPIVLSTYYGVRRIDSMFIWSARNMGANRLQLLLKVVVPAAAPHIFAGLRIALPIALVITVISEMIAATEGLGWLLTYAAASLSRSQVFAAVAVTAAIGFALDRGMTGLRSRIVFWEGSS